MTAGFPCFNPTCDHNFTLADIKGRDRAQCPRCGNVFELATSASPAPQQAQQAQPSKPIQPQRSPQQPPAQRPQPPQARRVQRPQQPPSPRPSPAQNTPPAPRPVPVPQPVSQAPTPAPAPVPYQGGQDQNVPSAVVSAQPNPTQSTSAPGGIEDLHDTEGGLVTASLPHRRRSGTPVWLIVLSCVFALLIVGGTLTWVFIYRPGAQSTDRGKASANLQTFEGYVRGERGNLIPAYKLAWPKGKWTQDDLSRKIAKRLKSEDGGKRRLCLIREVPATDDPNLVDVVWVAVAANDYVDKKPNEAELVRQAVFRLSACFRNEGDVERLATEKLPPEQFGDKDVQVTAQVIRFQGDFGGGTPQMGGKVYAFTHHGFGYCVIVGGTEPGVTKKVFDEFQNPEKGLGFQFWDERTGWRPEPPKINTYRAEKITLSLRAPEGIWTQKRAADFDAGGRLYLRGELKHVPKTLKNLKAAHVLVFEHNKATADLDEAMTAAQDYVLNRHKQFNEKYELRAADEKVKEPKGKTKKYGNRTTKVTDLQLTLDGKAVEFIRLVAVHTPDAVYGIECRCQSQFRDVWGTEFETLLSSLEMPK